MKTSVCVIFNHPFPSNIPILRSILKNRFDFVTFVIPNYRSDEEDVITTYRGSYTFQGMIVDAYPKLKEQDADFYFFVQDDVFLNPLYTGEELVDKLQIGQNQAFFPLFAPLRPNFEDWWWGARVAAAMKFPMSPLWGSGCEKYIEYLPPKELVEKKINIKYPNFSTGIEAYNFNELTKNCFKYEYENVKYNQLPLLANLINILNGNKEKINIDYPLVYGMSDMFAIHKNILESFTFTLGVMTSVQLWPEVAIPTSLVTHAENVKFAHEVGLEVEWLWLADRDRIDQHKIIEDFKNNTLLIHPVKLSKDIDILQNVIDALK